MKMGSSNPFSMEEGLNPGRMFGEYGTVSRKEMVRPSDGPQLSSDSLEMLSRVESLHLMSSFPKKTILYSPASLKTKRTREQSG